MGFWREPWLSTLSNFLLLKKYLIKGLFKGLNRVSRGPVRPVELIVREGKAKGIGKLVGDGPQLAVLRLDALHLLGARIREAQFTRIVEHHQGVGQGYGLLAEE